MSNPTNLRSVVISSLNAMYSNKSSLCTASIKTWPCVPHSPQVQDAGVPGCDTPLSSERSTRFAAEWTLGCRVSDSHDVSKLFDSARLPAVYSSQIPLTSMTAHYVSRHKHFQFSGANFVWLPLHGNVGETLFGPRQRAIH